MSGQSVRSDLLQQLRQLGVETVTAEYDGAGDEGQIETPEFGSSEVSDEIVRAVESLFYELLEQLYGGWEDNEGACGQFTWNVENDKIHLVHHTRQEAYETEEQNL
jgi:hypothetical protein